MPTGHPFSGRIPDSLAAPLWPRVASRPTACGRGKGCRRRSAVTCSRATRFVSGWTEQRRSHSAWQEEAAGGLRPIRASRLLSCGFWHRPMRLARPPATTDRHLRSPGISLAGTGLDAGCEPGGAARDTSYGWSRGTSVGPYQGESRFPAVFAAGIIEGAGRVVAGVLTYHNLLRSVRRQKQVRLLSLQHGSSHARNPFPTLDG